MKRFLANGTYATGPVKANNFILVAIPSSLLLCDVLPGAKAR